MIVYRSPRYIANEALENMEWMHANSIPFLVRVADQSAAMMLKPKFYSSRFMKRSLEKAGASFGEFGAYDRYEFMIRERDKVIFRIKFPRFFKITIWTRLHHLVGTQIMRMVAEDIIGAK